MPSGKARSSRAFIQIERLGNNTATIRFDTTTIATAQQSASTPETVVLSADIVSRRHVTNEFASEPKRLKIERANKATDPKRTLGILLPRYRLNNVGSGVRVGDFAIILERAAPVAMNAAIGATLRLNPKQGRCPMIE